jgi:SAM-dependent methyltransferase
MALDILLRGNARRWAWLKWLVDLSAILRRLDDDGHAKLIAMISQAGIEPMAAASFLTHRALLGELPGRVGHWLDSLIVTPEIATRHAIHLDAVSRLVTADGTPLPADNPVRPHLPQAARALARPLARGVRSRLAAWSRRSGQYQRDPATRSDRYPLAFRFARDQVGDGGGTRILSFGCSTGEEVFTLRRYFPGATIKGIEVDPARVRTCEARLRQAGDPDIAFECAATASGEAAESHDAVFCMAVFRDPVLDSPMTRSTAGHVSFGEFERGIEDLVRCLKPGGLLFVEHSNFRIADTRSAPMLEAVLHADPPRSGMYPGLYGRDGRRIDGAEERALGYRKRLSPWTGPA